MPINASADGGTYSELLTASAQEHGSGGDFITDLVAPVMKAPAQDYSVPKFKAQRNSQGRTQTTVGSDGSLNIRTGHAPTFVPGKAIRRGVKTFIRDEDRAHHLADLFVDEEAEVNSLVDELRLEREIALKAALDVVGAVSGYYASPSVKWDATSGDPIIPSIIEAGVRAAELNSGMSVESGNWKIIIPPLVADVVRGYLRTKLLYTDAQFQVNGILPAKIGGVDVICPGAMRNTAAQGQTASVARIWNTDDVYIVYVDPKAANARRTFTAFGQMVWDGVTPRYAVEKWRDPEKDVKRDWISCEVYDSLEVLSQDGIYVLPNVLT